MKAATDRPEVVLLTRYLATPLQPDSGIGLHFRVLADALDAAGTRVHVLLLTEDAPAHRAALQALDPTWTFTVLECAPPRWMLPKNIPWSLHSLATDLSAAVRALIALLALRARAPRLVVETHSTSFPALFLHLFNLPVIVRVSTTMSRLDRERGLSSRWLDVAAGMERIHLAHSPVLLTHSERHCAEVCAETGLAPRRFAIIPHGLPAPQGEDWPSPLAAPDGLLLYVGRFEKRKGIDTLLAALPDVLTRHPRLHVALVGGGGDGDPAWHEPLAAQPASVRDRVHRHGRLPTEELEALWRRATLFVAPSRYESFGLVYVEAMARGVAPVGCAVGGVPDVVTDGIDGLLVPPDDPKRLVEAIHVLLENPERRRRIGEAALATYRSRFDTHALTRSSLSLYRRLREHVSPAEQS